jgi:hypothetical protein
MRVSDQQRGEREPRPPSPWPARALPPLLLGFAVGQIVLGLLLWLAPGTFFEEIGPYGTRNDHYMGDLATFYLALGAGSLVAVVRSGWRVPVLAVGFIQYVLHSLNHLIDIGDADPGWLGPVNLIALAATAALIGWMLKVAWR